MSLKINYDKYSSTDRKVEESNLSIANGYLGMRGSFEEGMLDQNLSIEGTYINAFYDYFDIQYAAKYTGYPDIYQRMVPVVNAQNIEIYIDGERILFDEQKISNYNLELDMTSGLLKRNYVFNFNSEEYLELEFNKLLDQQNYELFLQDIVLKTNFKTEREVSLKFPLIFKENSVDKGVPNDPRALIENYEPFELIEQSKEENKQLIVYKTLRSEQSFVYGTFIKGLESFDLSNYKEGIEFTKKLLKEEIKIDKVNVIYENNFGQVNIKTANEKLVEYSKKDFEFYLERNSEFFKDFWRKADSNFGDKNSNLLAPNNFNMFQLYTHVGKLPWTNVAAKGLSGEGYAGHYFWDSEIYIVNALTLFDPELARLMLMFRYNTLEQAKERAKIMTHSKGALYPWRTINGEETSTYYPAGTAQYHINGDIAFAIVNYFKATKDFEFLFNYGLDILVETSRLWEDKIVVSNGVGHINSVTGPDEYQIIVNDDYWTNSVAEFNLQWVGETLKLLKEKDSSLYDKKIKQLNISDLEISEWEKLSKIIYHNFDKDLKLNPQHDNFLKRKPVTKEFIEEHKPFLRKLHPLAINTLRVTKQADVVLSNLFFYNKNDSETMKNNWHFYDATDTADSSLSKCIYAIMAARLKIGDYGFEYFKDSINLDLYDTHKNTDRGLHMANMGGARMFVIYGLLGINIELEHLELSPRYNEIIEEYKVNVIYQNSEICFEVKNKVLYISKQDDSNIKIVFEGQEFNLQDRLEIKL
ncbi:maltose phosphorylase [Spiroplasma chinense]|uniref:Maltose phosphorylase n=1 Tax=Spiroplasma chinense TaxID=216932 RepID=A0A5B9Y4K6_9MOLU|nr:glycoside hydrolase family 65 protein [Spiroplasma chinense]QEH61703.1 maltose phosphorylase [Spiroplasma chinense]